MDIFLYNAISGKNKEEIKYAGFILNKEFNKYSTKSIIKLSERFRAYSSLDWYINWGDIDISSRKNYFNKSEEYITILKLGTFHPNGYFRERCLRELIKFDGALSFIILRMNDWVFEISEIAFSKGIEYIEICSLYGVIEALPYLEKVKNSTRRSSNKLTTFTDKLMKKFKEDINKIDLLYINTLDYYTKKILYRWIVDNTKLPKEKILELIRYEKNLVCKRYLVRTYIKNYNCTSDEIIIFLKSKDGKIREEAICYKYYIEKSLWIGIEKYLLDKSKIVRESVRFIMKKEGVVDYITYYTDNLNDKNNIISIIGIGEVGTKEDVHLIISYLGSNDERVVKYTLYSIGLLLEHSASEIYWKYLFDKRVSVSNIAYKNIRKFKVSYSCGKLYESFLKVEDNIIKDRLVVMIINECYWDRLPYLLLFYNYKNEYIKKLVRDKLLYLGGTFIKPTKDHIKIINQVLKSQNGEIPMNIIKKVKFEIKGYD